MNEELPSDSDTLVDEIIRYLAAVELFRACDCEPSWRPEPLTHVASPAPSPELVPQARIAH